MPKSIALRLLLAGMVSIVQIPASSADQNTTAQRAASIVTQWQSWVSKHKISQASIAVSYNGQLVSQKGMGRDASTPAPVASLSKAITAMCIAKLINTTPLTFDTRVNAVIPEFNTDVSIGALMTHTSGYQSDITQRPDKFPGLDKEHLTWIVQQELAAGKTTGAVQSFSYNNANYAMLGAVIAAQTGKTYEQACNELVLMPADIKDATLNPDWRIMASWGGWKLSAVSYLKFVDRYFSNSRIFNSTPDQYPHHQFDWGGSYGTGTFFRNGRNNGVNFWHDGKWHSDHKGIKYRFAAYFAKWDNGWAVSTNHNISAINNEHAELDQLLAGAAHKPD